LSFSDLAYSAVDADPALITAAFFPTTAGRLVSGTEALHASSPRLLLGKLHDPAVTADPAGFAFAISASFLLSTERFATSGATFLLGHLNDLSVHAAPNGLLLTMRARFLFGAVTLIASLPRLRFGDLDNFSVNAAPPSGTAFASPLRIFLGTVALEFARLRIGNTHLLNVPVDADPAKRRRSSAALTSVGGFFFRLEPFAAVLLAIRFGLLDNAHAGGCVNAAPPRALAAAAASFARCFLCIVALATRLPALLFRRLEWRSNEGSLNTAPTRLAVRGRRCLRGIALKISGLRIRLGHLHRFAIEADPARLAIFLMSDRFFS